MKISKRLVVQRFDFGQSSKSRTAIIAEFVRMAREFAGLSLARLAQKYGHVADSNMRHYERLGMHLGAYKGSISLRTLIRIAHACRLNLAIVITPKNEKPDAKKPFVFLFEGGKRHAYHCRTVGKIYTALKEKFGLTQMKYAKNLGMSPAALSIRERGISSKGEPAMLRFSTLLEDMRRSGFRISLILYRRPQHQRRAKARQSSP